MTDLVRVSNIVDNITHKLNIKLSLRNRAADRRKPNAFHWLDENWMQIGTQIFDGAVVTMLGHTRGVKKPGPKKGRL
jgi:hypothetical protein